jgi:hypothetical protein
LGQWLRPANRAWSSEQLNELHGLIQALISFDTWIDEPCESLKDAFADIESDFEDYCKRQETTTQEETAMLRALDKFNYFLESSVNLLVFGKFRPTSFL